MRKFILAAICSSSLGYAATPVISKVQSSAVTANSVTITWTTNIRSDSRVNYGLTTSYGNTRILSPLVTQHEVVLTNLKADTLYNFRVRSKADSKATSPNFTFKTLAIQPPPPPPPSGAGIAPGTSWYWQLQGSINTSRNAKVYDIDLFDTSVSQIASLKQAGRTVICYFSAGTYEDWRPDQGQFPASVKGKGLGWPGEKWLDIRSEEVRQIMVNRINMAVSKGCDGLEPDNVDGYANNSGFPLTKQNQIDYLNFLAQQAHGKNLLIALKNATDLVSSLVGNFDFAVVEECFKYNECEAYSPFIRQNKAVLSAEYGSYSASVCNRAKSLNFSTVFFNLDLNGKVYNPCQ
jgi:hypothetical protein